MEVLRYRHNTKSQTDRSNFCHHFACFNYDCNAGVHRHACMDGEIKSPSGTLVRTSGIMLIWQLLTSSRSRLLPSIKLHRELHCAMDPSTIMTHHLRQLFPCHLHMNGFLLCELSCEWSDCSFERGSLNNVYKWMTCLLCEVPYAFLCETLKEFPLI